MGKIKDLLTKWSLIGIHFPCAHDPVSGKPSVSLFFLYVTFMIALGSNIALQFRMADLPAAIISILFWATAFVFYRLRSLDSAGVNLKTGQIEIKDTEDTPKPAPKGITPF